MPCYVSAERMRDYLEDRLLPTEAETMARHLVSCDACRELAGVLEQEMKREVRVWPWWLWSAGFLAAAAALYAGAVRWVVG